MPQADEMRLYDVDDGDDHRVRPRTPSRIENCLVEVPLGNQLGRLGLTANGDVAGIEFDDRALRNLRSTNVGEYVVAAYQTAVAQAQQRFVDEHHRKHGR